MNHELHCYEYVNRPFDGVRAALVADALRFMWPATDEAVHRARIIGSQLSVAIGGFEIAKKIDISVATFQPHADAPAHLASEALSVEFSWKAATKADLFPSMKARLLVYPLSKGETQLDLHGVYEPPGGAIGAVADRILGERIAKAAVHRFLQHLKGRLTEAVPPPSSERVEVR